MAQRSPSVLHFSALDPEGCPVDPTSPVPSPDGPGGGAGGRTSEVGQMLAKWARNPDLLPYEELFRTEPSESWFDPSRNPDQPTQFELATVRPDAGQSILLFDYEIQSYSFSGISAIDYQPIDDGLLSGVFGYSFRVNGMEPGQLKYRLDPVSSIIREQGLRFNERKILGPNELTSDDYQISQSQGYASAAGFGTALHPQTRRHYGARGVPFTEYIHDDVVLQIRGVVYRPVEIPLAFIQTRLSGFRCSSQLAKQLVADLRKCLR